MANTTVRFRGATVHFDAIFTDANGAPATPATVELSINYFDGTKRTEQPVAMTFDVFTNSWVYDWDSSISQPCDVNWSIKSDPATPPVYVCDGCFPLSANIANSEGP